MALLRRKGVYPYSWADDNAKFAVAALPGIEVFHDNLDGKPSARALVTIMTCI
jgi:hypothetical protein